MGPPSRYGLGGSTVSPDLRRFNLSLPSPKGLVGLTRALIQTGPTAVLDSAPQVRKTSLCANETETSACREFNLDGVEESSRGHAQAGCCVPSVIARSASSAAVRGSTSVAVRTQ